MTPSKILVPVDFTLRSRAAVEMGSALAERLDASCSLLHVWETVPLLHGTESMFLHTRAAAARRMTSFVDSLEGQLRTPLGIQLQPGEPADVILKVALRDGYDLIVMGTRANTGLAHLIRGSLTEKILRHSSCPVLTVHGADGPPAGEGVGFGAGVTT